jgi:hypothetical protein
MIAETTVIRRIVLKIRSSILKEVADGMIISTTMISAGPAAKADAKNRGHLTVFHLKNTDTLGI